MDSIKIPRQYYFEKHGKEYTMYYRHYYKLKNHYKIPVDMTDINKKFGIIYYNKDKYV